MSDDDFDDLPPTGGFRASRDRTLDKLAAACRSRDIAEVQRLARMVLTWWMPGAPPRDWAAFWRSLPPREMLEAAKAMPKIAGPWTATPGYEPAIYQRDALHGAKVEGMTVVFDDAPAGFTEVRVAWGSDWVKVPDRASADAALREAGWILVDPEPEDGGRG